MAKIKTILLLIIIAISLHSCSIFVGTKTLYRANNSEKINLWGYTYLDNDSIISIIYPQADSVFTSTIVETFSKYSLEIPTKIYGNISFDQPDTVKIISICKENNLDGLLLSKLGFINTTYYVYFIPAMSNVDAEVEMKLFTKDGKVVAVTRHNTYKGSDYWVAPTTAKTIHDATQRALKKIIKILDKT